MHSDRVDGSNADVVLGICDEIVDYVLEGWGTLNGEAFHHVWCSTVNFDRIAGSGGRTEHLAGVPSSDGYNAGNSAPSWSCRDSHDLSTNHAAANHDLIAGSEHCSKVFG